MGPFTKIFVSFSLQRVKNVDFIALLEGAMQKRKNKENKLGDSPMGFPSPLKNSELKLIEDPFKFAFLCHRSDLEYADIAA